MYYLCNMSIKRTRNIKKNKKVFNKLNKQRSEMKKKNLHKPNKRTELQYSHKNINSDATYDFSSPRATENK